MSPSMQVFSPCGHPFDKNMPTSRFEARRVITAASSRARQTMVLQPTYAGPKQILLAFMIGRAYPFNRRAGPSKQGTMLNDVQTCTGWEWKCALYPRITIEAEV